MLKSLFITLAILSVTPAFADESLQSSFEDAAVNADLRIDFGPGGIGLGWTPGRRPHWGRPGRPPMVQCVARNGRGVKFFGRAWDDRRAAQEAMWNCRHSRDTYNPASCYVVGCRWN